MHPQHCPSSPCIGRQPRDFQMTDQRQQPAAAMSTRAPRDTAAATPLGGLCARPSWDDLAQQHLATRMMHEEALTQRLQVMAVAAQRALLGRHHAAGVVLAAVLQDWQVMCMTHQPTIRQAWQQGWIAATAGSPERLHAVALPPAGVARRDEVVQAAATSGWTFHPWLQPLRLCAALAAAAVSRASATEALQRPLFQAWQAHEVPYAWPALEQVLWPLLKPAFTRDCQLQQHRGCSFVVGELVIKAARPLLLAAAGGTQEAGASASGQGKHLVLAPVHHGIRGGSLWSLRLAPGADGAEVTEDASRPVALVCTASPRGQRVLSWGLPEAQPWVPQMVPHKTRSGRLAVKVGFRGVSLPAPLAAALLSDWMRAMREAGLRWARCSARARSVVHGAVAAEDGTAMVPHVGNPCACCGHSQWRHTTPTADHAGSGAPYALFLALRRARAAALERVPAIFTQHRTTLPAGVAPWRVLQAVEAVFFGCDAAVPTDVLSTAQPWSGYSPLPVAKACLPTAGVAQVMVATSPASAFVPWLQASGASPLTPAVARHTMMPPPRKRAASAAAAAAGIRDSPKPGAGPAVALPGSTIVDGRILFTTAVGAPRAWPPTPAPPGKPSAAGLPSWLAARPAWLLPPQPHALSRTPWWQWRLVPQLACSQSADTARSGRLSEKAVPPSQGLVLHRRILLTRQHSDDDDASAAMPRKRRRLVVRLAPKGCCNEISDAAAWTQ